MDKVVKDKKGKLRRHPININGTTMSNIGIP
jgi:hypothetical protein